LLPAKNNALPNPFLPTPFTQSLPIAPFVEFVLENNQLIFVFQPNHAALSICLHTCGFLRMNRIDTQKEFYLIRHRFCPLLLRSLTDNKNTHRIYMHAAEFPRRKLIYALNRSLANTFAESEKPVAIS